MSKRVEKASSEVAEFLQLEKGDSVIHVNTVRLVAETRVCVIDHFLSAERFIKINSRFRNGSLQKFMQTHYQIDFERNVTLISATQPTPEIAQHLQLRSDIPMLCIKTLNCNALDSNDCIEFSVSHVRSDCMQVQVGDVMKMNTKEAHL